MQPWTLICDELASALPDLQPASFDAVLCDPPYHLTEKSRKGSSSTGGTQTPFRRCRVGTDKGFMGKSWDGGDVAFRPETWQAVMRVMKPGAYLMAFGGSRTFHRLAVALEDAGFILVDTLMWVYGQGFPKSRDIVKDIARSFPASNDATTWGGYGTALKPAYEPILLCRKPGERTFAKNVVEHGCGALNIDGSRIQSMAPIPVGGGGRILSHTRDGKADPGSSFIPSPAGRFPANLLLDEEAAAMLDASGLSGKGGASRFFYTGKAKTGERTAGMPEGFANDHPTLKPFALTEYLAKMLLPPTSDTRLLVPFSGAGSEVIGAMLAGWGHVTGIDKTKHYIEITKHRIAHWTNEEEANGTRKRSA